MPTTSKGLRYPASGDSPNGPQQIQNLATDVDALLFTGGGSSGAIAGSVPSTGTPLIVKTYYASVTLNSNGDGTVNFPGGGFPNGLLSLTVTHYSPGTAPSNNIEFVPWGATLATTNVRCYFGTATFGSTGVACVISAIGW